MLVHAALAASLALTAPPGDAALQTGALSDSVVQAPSVGAPRLSGGVHLRVEHFVAENPTGSVMFRLEQRKAGSWNLIRRYRVAAGDSVRQFAVPAGRYRVWAKRGGRLVLSRTYRYTPKPRVTFISGLHLGIDLDPDLPGRKSWGVTLQRKVQGRWVRVQETRSRGPRETLRLDQPDGTYRVITHARGRFPRALSQAFGHRRSRDLTPPGAVQGLRATALESAVLLHWVNPADEDLAEIVVRRSEGGIAPGNPRQGAAVPVSPPRGSSTSDGNLSSDTEYTYSVFAVDGVGNWSRPVSVRVSTTRPTVRVWLTTADGRSRLEPQSDLRLHDGHRADSVIRVDPTVKFQTYEGVGAAMTESSAWLLGRLSPEARTELMRKLFATDGGIGINLLRVPIGASDFALSDYTYDDLPAGQTDPQMDHFSIARDEQHVLPALRAAKGQNEALALIASPWSAPAWMKTNGSLHGGTLNPAHRPAYARYLSRFLQSYAAAGVPVGALTVQNEPMHQTSSYPSMGMTASEQGAFIRDHLAPEFARSQVDPQILALDHNWDLSPFADQVLSDPSVRDVVDGVAFHCYGGSVSEQGVVRSKFPSEAVWLTECSGGRWSPDFGDNMAWMMRNLVVGNFRNWGRTMLLWNLALDPMGGPTNGGCMDCRGVVTVDPSRGTVEFNEEYYALAHVTRAVDPGGQRIQSTGFGPGGPENVAFVNPDGSLGLVVHSDSARRVAVDTGVGAFEFDMPAGATASFRWRGGAGTERLPHSGGILQDFESAGSFYPEYQVDASLASDIVRSGESALAAIGKPGTWHTVGAFIDDGPVDVSSMNRVCLWVFETGTPQDANTVGLRLIDVEGNSHEVWSDDVDAGGNPKTVKNAWTRMCFALRAFRGVDLSSLERAQFAVYWQGSYRFDALSAE